MNVVIPTFAGLFGAAIGSFLNVCVHRWPRDESVVSPPSSCPGCGARIGWRDNIPILGWLLLGGQCRNCRCRISGVYPFLEAATGAVWLASVLRYGVGWQALTVAIFFTILLGIAMTDARTYIIPDEFTLGGLAIGLGVSLLPDGLTPVQSITGAATGFGVLYLTAMLGEWWMKRQAMGGGDIKMMAMVGAFLGPVGALLTIFLGALVGTIVFAPITIRSGKLVPFGIFLAVGAIVTQLSGTAILDWYRATLLGG